MHRRNLIALATLAFTALTIFGIPQTCAAQRPKKDGRPPPEDRGAIEGAIWEFTLTPAAGNPAKEPLRGKFRLKDLKIYQGETEDDKDMTKEVGSSDPADVKRPNRARITLTEFRAYKKGERSPQIMKGTADIESETKDKNNGKFIDANGYHWRIRQVRVQD